MFRTLYGKIATILLSLFFFVGILYILLALFTMRTYIREVDQRLNRRLASFLVSRKFFIEEGKVNEEALRESFDTFMEINPNIELYLLDTEGTILSFAAPPGKVKRKRISLDPVKQYLEREEKLPILGDDPRNPEARKVFTASPVPLNGPTEGYLYIILGGEEHDSVAAMLESSYILRLSTGILISGLLFTLVTGLFLFNLVTRRLRKLAASMEQFQESDFREPTRLARSPGTSFGDEIDRLGDIFEKMGDRIIEQFDKVAKVDSLRRELVSNISHDLRTPLASLRGYIETLHMKGNEMAPKKQRDYLATALKHSDRLSKLVSDLFELAKLDSQETKVSFEPFHIGELVQDTVQKYRLVTEEKRINLQAIFPENLPHVSADIGLIERAIQNLIDNAIRFTPESGNVTVKLHHQRAIVRVEISDDGPGIKEDDIPYIFERYYRAQPKDEDDSGSAGLGLAITKRIVELHGSEIGVTSESGRGTTFTFHLPVCEA